MTRYFLDTSALVKHYHTELGTDAVDRIIGEAGAELLIARLTLVETISVFAIKPPRHPSRRAAAPLEGHLRHRRPVAVVGVVENGLVRLLDPRVRLPEQSRVIVVAAERS